MAQAERRPADWKLLEVVGICFGVGKGCWTVPKQEAGPCNSPMNTWPTSTETENALLRARFIRGSMPGSPLPLTYSCFWRVVICGSFM